MSRNEQNGWNEYSRLVLKELETLSDGIESLQQELQSVKEEIAKMQVKEEKIDELKAWKEKVDEVVSPSQLLELKKEVESLNAFKTRAITAFTVIQFVMAGYVWMMKVVS